ncbi:MAG: GIN domain-containing protein [Bacteroidaceae bacterium]
MKKMILFIMAMAICMGAIAAQSKETQEKTVSVSQFDKVSIAASFTVRYTQGPKHKCTIIASPEDMKKVKAEVKDKQLKIYVEGQKKDAIKMNGITFNNASIYGEVIVKITSPELTKVSCLGSGDFVATTDIKSEDLEFMISGSGSVKLKNVTADKLRLSTAGSGGIDIQQANTENLNAEVAGSGGVDLSNVASTCKKARLSVAGSGDINTAFSNCQELECRIAGSGRIGLKGKVVNYKSSVFGSGEVIKRELEVTGDCRENDIREKPKTVKTVNNINARP